MNMETGVILVLLSLAAVVSSQVEPPPDKGSSTGGVMSSIFEWANSVRPFVPVDGKAAGASDEGLPPVPLSPESGPRPELGLPPEPLLPKSEQGSSPFNQMLPPPVDKTPQQPPKPDVPPSDLPTDLLVKDPSPALPNMDQGFPDMQDPNQGLPGDVNLDADVIDPNLLFPSDTANAVPQKPGFENNDFLKNFLPEFPKGDKGVNINTGTSDSGSLPDASVGDPSLLGFPADKLPPKPDLPVNKPLVPDSSLPPSTGGNQPVKEPKPQSPDTVKPLLPSGSNLGRVPMDHFVPTDGTGRPISMIPINPVKLEPVPDLHSAVNPALGGINSANIKDTKLVGQESNAINPSEVLSKWMDIYSDGGRPESLNNVQAAHVKDIAPPTPDIAMLSHISLVNYGKDKAMRAMLREQRKQERMERRLEMRQNGNRGRGNSGNQGNPGQGRGLAMGRGRGQGR